MTRISSDPRWLFFRLAILVTLVLWLPDLWILYQRESADAVAVLMVMHLAIALVTYNLLVHLAPVRPAAGGSPAGSSPSRGSASVSSMSASSMSARSAAAERGAPAAERATRARHRHAR